MIKGLLRVSVVGLVGASLTLAGCSISVGEPTAPVSESPTTAGASPGASPTEWVLDPTEKFCAVAQRAGKKGDEVSKDIEKALAADDVMEARRLLSKGVRLLETMQAALPPDAPDKVSRAFDKLISLFKELRKGLVTGEIPDESPESSARTIDRYVERTCK